MQQQLILWHTNQIWPLRIKWPGWLEQFEKTVHYIREKYPDIFIIADAKRGDIGNTSAMYAKTF